MRAELTGLSESGVTVISLNYIDARRRDPHGNELRYSSLVRLRRATTQAVDVFFLLE